MSFKAVLKAVILIAVVSAPVYILTLRSVSQKYQDQIKSLQAEIQLKDRAIVDLEDKLSPPKTVSIRSVIQVSGVSPSGLQQALKKVGLFIGPIDGKLTQKTVNAVKEFQRIKNLKVDGVVGKNTWRLLENEGKSLHGKIE